MSRATPMARTSGRSSISDSTNPARARWIAAAVVFGLGIPLACQAGFRDAKDPPPADPSPPPAESAPEAPRNPDAPPLFPDGLPVVHQSVPEGIASLSAQTCNGCHYAVHDEWSTSSHRGARSHEPFRTAAQATGDSPLCTSCHAPLANQQTAVVTSYPGGPLSSAVTEPNDSWDATLSQEGVTCAACHVRDGQVVGTNAVARDAPHPVAVSEELGTSAFCGTCHQLDWPGASEPLYDTWGEWSRSGYAAAGIQCQDCHMPPTTGVVTAGRYQAHAGHAFDADPGRALTILVDMAPGGVTRGETVDLQLELLNTGAGHSYPTGSPFSAVVLEVQVVGPEGKPVGEPWQHTLQKQVADAPPWTVESDNRIAPGQGVTLPVTLDLPHKAPSGAGALEVRLRRTLPDGSLSEPEHVQRIPISVY